MCPNNFPVCNPRGRELGIVQFEVCHTVISLPLPVLNDVIFLSLQTEEGLHEGLRLFQERRLAESDEDWYRLIPEEARAALGKKEVQRQSVIFEAVKSERNYVDDLEAVKEVTSTSALATSL
jgi:hypothetical protein